MSPNAPPEYWPTDGWRSKTPEELGVDSEQLAKACDLVVEQELSLHSLLVIRHGYVAADVYFYPFTSGTLHDLASCSKSFTSTLVGIAIDTGYIESVEQPVLDLLPGRDVANVDTRKQAMTLEHLLTMSSGLGCYAEPAEPTLQEMMRSPDWAQFTLDLPMREPPGTRFEYCSPTSYLLSVIVQEATGMTALDFAREHLFGPLGISEAIWSASPQGATLGWGDLHLTPHDMAKLGYLFLHQGRWADQQIVSAGWVAAATSKKSTPPDSYGYGYQWWLHSTEIFGAEGRGGQQIIVAPDLDAVVVFTGGLDAEGRTERDHILTSLIRPVLESRSPLAPNPDSEARLKAAIQRAAAPRDKPARSTAPSAAAGRISGLTYELDPNLFGLNAFSLSFPSAGEALLSLSGRDSPIALAVGLDGVFRLTPNGRFGLPARARGGWRSDDVFALEFDEIANINFWRIAITFSGEQATLRMEDPGLGERTLNGRLKQQ